jgi:hypothetical protein
MYLHRDDVKLISEIMDEFPDAVSFRLETESGGGIGYTLKLIVATKIKNKDAEVTFEIAGVENW